MSRGGANAVIDGLAVVDDARVGAGGASGVSIAVVVMVMLVLVAAGVLFVAQPWG